MIIVLPLLVSLIGLVVYALSNKPKVEAIALHMFWVGLLVFLAHFNGMFKITN
jgi:hypothetical protein